MGKTRVFWILVIMCVAVAPSLSSAESPAAVLLACKGDVVVVKSGGEKVNGAFGLALEPGDEVRTGKASQAEIHFDNGHWVQIGPSSSTRVHGSKTHTQVAGESMGEKSFEVVQNFLKLKDSEGTSSLARLRSGGKHAELRAASPMQTKIRNGAPTFRWTVSDPSTELRLTIYGDEGIHWQHEIPKGTTNIPYPPDAPELLPDVTYSWVLETTDPLVLPPLRSEAAFFEVLSTEENRQVDASLEEISQTRKPGESTYHFVCASVYFDHGLTEDAIAETSKALAFDPENTELHAILARLYAQTGRSEEALREYNRLLEHR